MTDFHHALSPVTDFATLLRANVERRRSHVAIRFLEDGERETVTLTYGELDRRVRAAAARIARDAKPGDRVVLLYTSGVDFVVALLGCFYAGVIAVPLYLPLNHRAITTTEKIIRHAAPVLCLTDVGDELTAAGIDRFGVPLVRAEELSRGDAEAWSMPVQGPESIAFLQYTSGSTAEPKGVMVLHRNLLANQQAIHETFGQSEDSIVVNWLPLYHDMGLIGGVLHALYLGATCVLMSQLAFLQRPMRWLEAIHKYRATVSAGPNFAYSLCADRATAAEIAALDLSSWRVACCGGEPVRAETLARFVAVFERAGYAAGVFAPCYGLAESTLLVSGRHRGAAVERDSATAAGARLVSNGRTVASEIAIVRDGVRRADGGEGEIWLRGPSVAGGYYDDPDATAATFGAMLADGTGPFLRTGDLGFLVEGDLFVTGRSKDLLIVRGQNHFPQDIEATIDELGVPFRRGCGAVFQVGEQIVVVQEIRAGVAATAELVDRLRAAIVQVHGVHADAVCLCPPGSVAKTSSGKIRRGACRDAYLAGEYGPAMATAAPVASATNGVGERVARILGLDGSRLDRGARLTALGLDSLKAVQLQHELEKHHGVKVPLSALLDGVSVGDLEAGRLGAPVAPPAHEAGDVGELSLGEQALYFLSRLGGTVPTYGVSRAFWLSADTDIDALAFAFAALLERHPILRSRYAMADRQLVRTIEEAAAPLSLASVGTADRAAMEARIVALADAPFDLERGGLFRATVLRSDDSLALVVSAHHIVVDFVAAGVLLRELGILYTAARMGVPIALPPPEASFAAYVSRQKALVASDTGQALSAFWKAQLPSEIPVLRLPSDRTRPATPSAAAHCLTFPIPPEVGEAIRAIARAEQTTTYAVLLAAWSAFVHRVTGDASVIVGTPTAARRHPFGNVVGFFVNTLPIAFDFATDVTFAELVGQTKVRAHRALDAQELPLARIVEAAAPARTAGQRPLFETMFGLLADPDKSSGGLTSIVLEHRGAQVEIGGLELEVLPLPCVHAVVDLDLLVGEIAGAFHCRLMIARDVLTTEGAAAIARYWAHYLAGLVADATASIRRPTLVDDLTTKTRHERLNPTGPTPAPEMTLDRLFDARVRARPHAIALTTPEESFSYRRLNNMASHVAAALRRTTSHEK